MLLSFIIPVFNGENKIARCLESLIRLNDSQVEFLVINDGSTDSTETIVKEYAEKDSRVCLINQNNTGVSGARNKGLSQCKGKYVGFIDADDEITECFEQVLEALKREDYDFFGFDYLIHTDAEVVHQKRALFIPGINSKKVLCDNFLTGASNNVWSNVYKREIIQKNTLQFDKEMKMGEDSVFNAKYIRSCSNFYYINCPAYKYYYDDMSSASFKCKLSYLEDFVKMYEGFQSVYEWDKNLNFSLKWELYFGPVYEILKKHGKSMSGLQNRKFRKSGFYKEISSRKQDNWKAEIRRWLIKANLYRIYLP